MNGVLVVIQLVSCYQQVLHDDILEQVSVEVLISPCLDVTSAEEDGYPLG